MVGIFRRLDGKVVVLDIVVTAGGRGCVEAFLRAVMSVVAGGVRVNATYLDEVLALRLGHERLKLRRGECVDQPRLGNDKQEDLSASQD